MFSGGKTASEEFQSDPRSEAVTFGENQTLSLAQFVNLRAFAHHV